MPSESVTEQAGKIVEERVAYGLEAEKACLVLPRSLSWKRTEPVVLPENVVAALDAVSDPQPPLPRATDELTVAQQRPEDHLELDRVGRHST